MKKPLVAMLAFGTMLLALPAAAQAQAITPAETTATRTDSPGETVFLSLYTYDQGCFRATFDTDNHFVGGLTTKALDAKFDRFCSLAQLFNFMRQNGYRVVSFVPKLEPIIDGTMSRPRINFIIFEYVGSK